MPDTRAVLSIFNGGKHIPHKHFPGGTGGKDPTCQCGFSSLGWEDLLEEGMATHSSIPRILVFSMRGESHGQRSLVGYSPQDHKELDMTEAT